MTKPYVFCHMMTSLDGKIIGNYMRTPQAADAGKVFYELAFGEDPHYRHQGWLSGRITTDDNFTHYREPVLDEGVPQVPEGDFVAVADAEKYYVSIDPSGRLGWDSPDLTYQTTTAHVLEVLTGKASNAYKAFLRELGISYVIVGDAEVDFDLLLDKLAALFGIETLMLGGGGVLNWSFIQAGLCDEISVVIAPVADGDSDSPALFETAGRASDEPRGFELQSVQTRDGGSVWLRYTVNSDQS
ncbi:dihydrofolate reductase family protein [Nocardiopsis sp. CNS-639]|uniref:dihydrofolate reductase family protein n=1 Tax=Nocardiopsis sp. CNS-639 TaxID=1169153 RepID=UPI00047704BC|nr:RibD family protein [Nocardiopsis sp. CNS-639]